MIIGISLMHLTNKAKFIRIPKYLHKKKTEHIKNSPLKIQNSFG